MSPRRIFFWMHLSAGCIAGLVILVMSFTGAMLAFEKQIIARAERSQRTVPVVAGASRLSPAELLTKLKEPAAPTNILWHSDPAASVEIGFGRERTLFVNPYNGERLGEGAPRLRAFLRGVEEWHRWLGTAAAYRNWGRGVTAACNLAFLFMVCSGLYLWLPRNWSWLAVRKVIFFRGGLQGKAREFNWHNVIGLWCCVPLFVIVCCSVVMSYPWANNLVYRISGNEPPKVVATLQAAISVQGSRGASPIDSENLNELCAAAERKTQTWRTISLRLPRASDATAVFSIDAGNGGQPEKRSQLTLNRKSGGEVRWEPFASYNKGRRWRMWIRFTHTGEEFGLPGQAIAGLAALGGTFLVYTGISMALRRVSAWRAQIREIPSESTAAGVVPE
jgi:uncharacterized iron-regulated membrane protein